jgi:hypothetical protein
MTLKSKQLIELGKLRTTVEGLRGALTHLEADFKALKNQQARYMFGFYALGVAMGDPGETSADGKSRIYRTGPMQWSTAASDVSYRGTVRAFVYCPDRTVRIDSIHASGFGRIVRIDCGAVAIADGLPAQFVPVCRTLDPWTPLRVLMLCDATDEVVGI